MIKYIFTILLVIIISIGSAYAVQVSRVSPTDSRLRYITYHPKDVHLYTGFYDFQASILFGEGESIQTISLGDPSGWKLTPSANRLFIKPIALKPSDATTNMLLITNKRVYHFLLEAKEVGEDGINDSDLVWETKFLYPDSTENLIQQFNSKPKGPDLSRPEKFNFRYSISGSQNIAPKMIFDDEEFTYFLFEEKNANIPAFFIVDSEGKESLANYRMLGDYVVLERVTSQLTLRKGADIVCVFNEMRPLQKAVGFSKDS